MEDAELVAKLADRIKEASLLHENDRAPRQFFGKAYIWKFSQDGNLMLERWTVT